jgi:hypothetical protein
VVLEVDVVLGHEPPGDHGISIHVNHICGSDQRPEDRPDRVEAIVERFKHDRCVGQIEFWEVEKYLSFLGIGHRGLFEKNMFSCFDGLHGPFEVQSIWQWNENYINIGVVEDFLSRVSKSWDDERQRSLTLISIPHNWDTIALREFLGTFSVTGRHSIENHFGMHLGRNSQSHTTAICQSGTEILPNLVLLTLNSQLPVYQI